MKKFLLGTVAVLSIGAFAPASNAADLMDYPVGYDWAGWYAGATVGYGWGETRFDDGDVSNPFDFDGAMVGGTVGYNMMLSPTFLLGMETDFTISGMSGSFGPGNLGQPDGSGWTCGTGPCRSDVEWFSTTRLRLGYVAGSMLFYGTGGLAVGSIEAGIDNDTDFQTKDTNVGWTAGGGLEYAFDSQWTAKIEYLYVDLGWTDRGGTGGFFRADADFHVVRAGVNFGF